MNISPPPPQYKVDEALPDHNAVAFASDHKEEPKQGMGCRRACKETTHYKAWFLTSVTLFFGMFFFICHFACIGSLDSHCRCDCGAYDEDFFQYEDGNAVCPTASDGCGDSQTKCDFPCVDHWIPALILSLLYFVYLIEAFALSSSFKYLCNTHGPSIIDEIRATPPQI